jgi:glycine/D-amino acid oxidase-like deaminating enzyme
MDEMGAIVVGAGVIGLAMARELAAAGHETLILAAAERCGIGASSRKGERSTPATITRAAGGRRAGASLDVTGRAGLTASQALAP